MRLRQILVVLVVALALLVPLPALAEETATPSPEATPATGTTDGSITGQVTNGTPDGGSVAGLTVTLDRYQGMNLEQTYTTTTDEDGNFAFTDLPVNEQEVYLPHVTYADVQYVAQMVLLSQEPQSTVTLTVYETTNDPSVITLESRGVIISGADKPNSMIETFEILSLTNRSDRAYIGNDGVVLQVPLPKGTTQIIQQPGFDFGQPRVEDGVLTTTGAVLPGNSDAMFAYLVPYSGTKATLEFGSIMPTSALSVLVEEDTFEISSPAMQDAGTAEIAGRRYHVLTVERPVVGDVVSVNVSNLPRGGTGDSRRGPLFAGIAAVVGLAIAGALAFQLVRQRRQTAQLALAGGGTLPTAPEDLEDERLALAAELNQLEEEHASGKVSDEIYEQEREEILEELRVISRRLRGVEDTGA